MGSPLGSEEAGAVLGPDQYVCTLPSEVCKLAQLHLREEEQARETAIVRMRQFISSHPDITKCRMGTYFSFHSSFLSLCLPLSFSFAFFASPTATTTTSTTTVLFSFNRW